MSKVIVFGTGKGAKIAYKHFSQDSVHEVCGFFMDAEYRTMDRFCDLPVVTFEEVNERFPSDTYKMFVLMGFEKMNKTRAEKYFKGKQLGYDFASYVSSGVHSLDPVDIGENCFIMDNQTLNQGVRIGNNVVMWSGNHIGDDTLIQDHSYLCSHVCIGGDSMVGQYCFLGNNSTLADNVKVGDSCFIGANALIATHTESGSTYVVPPTEKSPMDSERFMQIMAMHCTER